MDPSGLFFRQLFDRESSTYTYLLADPSTREAALIDTVKEQVDRDLKLVDELGFKLKYVMETHVHADHITGADDIRHQTGAQGVVGRGTHVACADLELGEGEEVKLGRFKISALSTPGHTDGCMSYYVEGRLFTGDSLLIRGCGRTDFQQGSSEKLYESVTQKLFEFPDETLVYPAHDYQGRTVSTIGEEKRLNPRLGQGKTLQEFVKIMADLHLDLPKKIQTALPANLACGQVKSP